MFLYVATRNGVISGVHTPTSGAYGGEYVSQNVYGEGDNELVDEAVADGILQVTPQARRFRHGTVLKEMLATTPELTSEGFYLYKRDHTDLMVDFLNLRVCGVGGTPWCYSPRGNYGEPHFEEVLSAYSVYHLRPTRFRNLVRLRSEARPAPRLNSITLRQIMAMASTPDDTLGTYYPVKAVVRTLSISSDCRALTEAMPDTVLSDDTSRVTTFTLGEG